MKNILLALCVLLPASSKVIAQEPPSYAKEIRPIFVKYCLECHNAKALKGGLNLDSWKALIDGSDKGPVLMAGKPDESPLVTSLEGKTKPAMPPKAAKIRPKKEEIALVRAWVKVGGKDDGSLIKIAIPNIKPRKAAVAPVDSVTFDPAGHYLAFGRYKNLELIDLKNGVIVEDSLPGTITALAFNQRRPLLAVAYGRPGENGCILLRGTSHSPPPTQTFTNLHKDAILDLAFSPDGKYLVSSSYDMQIKLTPLDSPAYGDPLTRTLKEHSDAVYGIAFSPDSKQLASCSADRAVKVWDVPTGKLLYTLGDATDWLYTVAWSPDGKQLASGGVDRSIRVYKVSPSGAQLTHSVFAHEAAVQKIVYSEDSQKLYSLGQDRVLKAWDAQRMVETKTYDKLPETGLCLAVRAGEIAVGRYDGVLQIINAETGKQVRADIPVLSAPEPAKITPAEGRRGQTIRLIFEGKNLDQVQELVCKQDGMKSKIMLATATRLEADAIFPPTTPPGSYEVRLKNKVGNSKPISIIIDPFPTIRGGPGNNSPGTGVMVPLPISVIGKLEKAGDFSFYRFEVAKGQQLGVQILTKVVGSKISPYLQLTDMQGNVLAETNEGFLGYAFAQAGTYALGIRDQEYRGGTDMHYRLHLGTIPVVMSLFPLGVGRGSEADIRIQGVFLEKDSIHIKVPTDAQPGSKITVPVSSAIGKPLGKHEIVVGEFPELITGTKSADMVPPVPGTANGQLVQPGQKDTYRFTAKKGQALVVETNAHRLGSALDSVLEILDAKGNPVPRAVLRCQAKTFVTFRDHDSTNPNIRIEAWGELGVNDMILVGGELMKIKEMPTHPDADCSFFRAEGKRLGYLDTTPTHHSMNEPMYKVSIHPPGMTFPPNGYPIFTLPYRNDDGGPGYGLDSRILFNAPADGDYLVRVYDARGQGGDNYGYRLTVRPPRPSFNVHFNPTNPSIPRGGALPIKITADRLDGYEGPIDVRFDKLPPGFSAPPTTIEANQYSTDIALFADDDPKAAAPTTPLKLIGEAVIAGEKIHKESTGEAPKTVAPGEVIAFTDESAITVVPGKQVKLTVQIERRQGFSGRVPLEVRGLPHGVRVIDIGLNGILVNENEVRRTIVIYAEPWVEASSHPFVIIAEREGKNYEYATKSVILNVTPK